MDFKCSKEQHDICEKNSLCHLCDGTRLFKKPKWMEVRDKQAERKAKGIKKKKKEGMDFEKKAAASYNKQSGKTHVAARRRPNSGAIWHMPGDIVTEDGFLLECKERGTVTSRGEKTISIHKEWLDKVEGEAAAAKKPYWAILFGFKGSDDIYVAKSYQAELEMIQTIKALKERIEELQGDE